MGRTLQASLRPFGLKFGVSHHTPVEQPPGPVTAGGPLLLYGDDVFSNLIWSAVTYAGNLFEGQLPPFSIADIAGGTADRRKR
jgi:hypothetical protein